MPGRQGPQPREGGHISAMFPPFSPSASFMVLLVPFMKAQAVGNEQIRQKQPGKSLQSSGSVFCLQDA